MNVDPMRVIDVLKRKIADLTAENAMLAACVEQLEPQVADLTARLGEANQQIAHLPASGVDISQ